MSISFGLSRLTGEIVDAYTRLFPEDAADKGPAALSWRFSEGPHGPGLFALARDDEKAGRIVGMIGLIATKLKLDGAVCQAYQAIDTVVDPAYRGQGLFVGLGRAAHDGLSCHGGRVLWGFPNANAAPGWFGRLGWSNFGQVPFLIRPLRSGYFMRKLHPRLGSIDLPLIRSRKRDGVIHRVLPQFGPEADPILDALNEKTPSGLARDAAYLNWRLQRHPRHQYRTVGCQDHAGALVGFVSMASAEKHGGRISYVMEVLAARGGERATADLVRSELVRAAAAGAEVALAWCPPDAPNRGLYASAGFVALPERFRPIDIHFGGKRLSVGGPDDDRPLRNEGWYLSYLDSDTV